MAVNCGMREMMFGFFTHCPTLTDWKNMRGDSVKGSALSSGKSAHTAKVSSIVSKNQSPSNFSRATTHSHTVSIVSSQVNNELCASLHERACGRPL